MYYYIGILLLCIPAYLSQYDGCFHENFGDETLSAIANSCDIPSDPWIFDTFSDADIEPPPGFTSDGFIRVEGNGQHCLTNEQPLTIVEGSELVITYYATGNAILTVLISNTIDGGNIANEVLTMVYDEWTTERFTLSFSQEVFLMIIGMTPSGDLIVDSVTYVDEADQFDTCIYGDGGDEDGNGGDDDDGNGGDGDDGNGGDGEDGDGEDEDGEDGDGEGGDGEDGDGEDGGGEDGDGDNGGGEDGDGEDGGGEDGDGEDGDGEDGGGEDGNGDNGGGEDGDGEDGDGEGGDGEDGDGDGGDGDNSQPTIEPIDETDWLTIVIVLSVISGVLLIIIVGGGCYFLGRSRRKNVTNYPYLENSEGYTTSPLPRAQSRIVTGSKNYSLPRYYVA